MSISNIVKGTILLSSATLICRILGFIYFFPFQLLVGKEGVALYTYAYSWYGILLSFSTAGIPTAVSKFVAKYNAKGEYRTSQKMYQSSFILMLTLGIIGFLIFYIAAPYISSFVIRSTNPSEEFVESLTLTMRALSFALLIVPPMSITRGYFQGFQLMKPTAYSQVYEQIARVFFILAGSYVVIYVMKSSTELAVAVATFGAVIGAIASVFVLLFYWRKLNSLKAFTLNKTKRASDITTKRMFKEVLKYSIPIVIVGVTIPLYTLIDQYTVANVLRQNGYSEANANGVFAYVSNYAQKLTMIPISLATGFSLSIIPAITHSFFNNEKTELKSQILKIYQLLLAFTLPASLGLAAISYDIFRAAYIDPKIAVEGSSYLITYAPAAILGAIFTVSAAILQGIDLQRKTIWAFTIGVLAKVLLNVPFLHFFEGHGAILGTIIGYCISNTIMLYCIFKYTKFNFRILFKNTLQILLYSAGMLISIYLIKSFIHLFFTQNSYLESLIVVFSCVSVGVLIYLCLLFNSRGENIIVDEKMKKALLKKLKINKVSKSKEH